MTIVNVVSSIINLDEAAEILVDSKRTQVNIKYEIILIGEFNFITASIYPFVLDVLSISIRFFIYESLHVTIIV